MQTPSRTRPWTGIATRGDYSRLIHVEARSRRQAIEALRLKMRATTKATYPAERLVAVARGHHLDMLEC